ncbi:RSP_2648 family PIN domain-containing protein [Roseovarius sp. EL26]|uniref:RSP_2648 family PIN domain-containing protein n=1 Tax=Roseovarius sp. EL26 TaxID=2126672 RepID=UPI000EA391F8|nr:PIN domain-containing protein [Roseovarius sp. EL26]
MKLLLDTCVIYPTVMREMLLGVAAEGVYRPYWSARIIEEWQRAAIKLGPDGVVQAGAEAALLKARWPKAEVPASPGLEARLWLPDPADIHVLAAAISASADGIITLNKKDFPQNILGEEGLSRFEPDGFLHGVWSAQPDVVECVADRVLETANRLSGKEWDMRGLMKKARLPRLGKALTSNP